MSWRVTRLYTGLDGESHFEDIEVPVEDKLGIIQHSEVFRATRIIFRETDGDYQYSWHNAPRRQFVIQLEGELEIEIGDGTKRRLGVGDILLAEDTTGRGHIARAVDNQPRKAIVVPLEENPSGLGNGVN